VLRTAGEAPATAGEAPKAAVCLTDALTGRELRPQPVAALLEQSRKGKLVALAPKGQAKPREPVASDRADRGPPAESIEEQNALLDKQLFNVLMTAVRNSGLDISTELIVQVRDNEFRKREYHDAFEKLNQLAVRYDVAAARRKEELRRHDQWLASGQSGLSLREVEEAKLRNAQERTRLEHAGHRFGLVVEPLRILARSGSSDARSAQGVATP
jgi:hypothetical protein